MRAWPKAISVQGQLIAVVVIALLTAFGAILAAALFGGFERLAHSPAHIYAGRVAAVVDSIASATPAERPVAIALALRALPGATVFDRRPLDLVAEASGSLWALQKAVLSASPTISVAVVPSGPYAKEDWLVVALSDGRYLAIPAPPEARSPPFAPFIWLAASLVITPLFVAIWVTKQIRAPLRCLQSAAASFDVQQDWEPVQESGPRELRDGIAELNRMASRIVALTRERGAIMGAINHDLRLPVTRLRLLVEQVDDPELRMRGLANLKSIQIMLHASLDYLKHGRPRPVVCRFDLVALLQTVADEFADMGHDVAYVGPQRLALHGDPDLIERALNNLVDNATRFASIVRIDAVALEIGEITIAVIDDGPGIADHEKARLLAPFATTATDTGAVQGFGLGLAIVRMIAEVHGGRISLSYISPKGLTVTLTLPVMARAAPTPGPICETLELTRVTAPRAEVGFH
ncbi:sensor histidine kinase [Bosea thiooxidans]